MRLRRSRTWSGDGSSSAFTVKRVLKVQMPIATCGSALMVRYCQILARWLGASARVAWNARVTSSREVH